MIYSHISKGVRITVEVEYLPPDDQVQTLSLGVARPYVFAYHITMENHSQETLTLKTRHWDIWDGLGRLSVVDGEGVVGEFPRLEPEDRYDYSSGCPLPTPSGSMSGYYMFETDQGVAVKVDIPAFSLDIPQSSRILN